MDPGDCSHLKSQLEHAEMTGAEPSPPPVPSAGIHSSSLEGRASPHGPVTPSPDGRVHSHRPDAQPLGSPEPGLLASTFCTYLTLCFSEKISLGSLLFQPCVAATQSAACPAWGMRVCVFVCLSCVCGVCMSVLWGIICVCLSCVSCCVHVCIWHVWCMHVCVFVLCVYMYVSGMCVWYVYSVLCGVFMCLCMSCLRHVCVLCLCVYVVCICVVLCMCDVCVHVCICCV